MTEFKYGDMRRLVICGDRATVIRVIAESGIAVKLEPMAGENTVVDVYAADAERLAALPELRWPVASVRLATHTGQLAANSGFQFGPRDPC
jgi:hypothetical protein